MRKGLTEKEKALILANYFAFETRAELAIFVGCSLPNLFRFMSKMNPNDIPIKKVVEIIKPEKRKVVYENPSKIEEPEFSESEINSYSESFKELTLDFVGKRIEIINGKQCAVFQSRMNY